MLGLESVKNSTTLKHISSDAALDTIITTNIIKPRLALLVVNSTNMSVCWSKHPLILYGFQYSLCICSGEDRMMINGDEKCTSNLTSGGLVGFHWCALFERDHNSVNIRNCNLRLGGHNIYINR